MRKILVLCFVLSTVFLFAEEFAIAMPGSSPKLFANPATKENTFELGLFGYKISEYDDYGRIGAYSNFPVKKFQTGFIFDYTFLESFYERILSEYFVSYPQKNYGLGLGYVSALNISKKDKTYHVSHFLIGGYFQIAEWIGIANHFQTEEFGFWQNHVALFFSLENYRFYVEYSVEKKLNFQIGQMLDFNSFALEFAYQYPHSRFYLGIDLKIKALHTFFGINSVTPEYLGYSWKLFYKKSKKTIFR